MTEPVSNSYADSEENKTERKRLYERFRAENMELRQKSFEQFDKAVLTFSSGGLAISISFIKDIVPLEHLVCSYVLFFSWFCFVIAILSTLYSFKTAPKGIDESIRAAEDYYLNYKDDAFNRADSNVKLTRCLNDVSWWALLGGVVLTVFFTMINLNSYKEVLMSDKTNNQDSGKVHKMIFNDGVEPTSMQKAPGIRGVEPSKMQPAPKPTSGQSKSGSTGNSGSSKK